MSRINEILEWDYCGSQFSLYVKHFNDDEGKKGVKMIFEDESRGKVTEIVVPPRKYRAFLKIINDGAYTLGGSF